MGSRILLALLFICYPFSAISAEDVSQVYAYPVPFKPAWGHSRITFSFLPAEGTIRIYSASGEEIIAIPFANPSDGKIEWNAVTSAGEPLASGVYIYRIQTVSNSKTGKVMVIR